MGYMQVADVVRLLEAEVRTCHDQLHKTVNGGYVSDLLSDVMAQAAERCVWVTRMTHPNVVAVAALVGIPAVVMAGGVAPDAKTLAKAEQEKIVIITTSLSAFAACGRLYQAGLPAADKHMRAEHR